MGGAIWKKLRLQADFNFKLSCSIDYDCAVWKTLAPSSDKINLWSLITDKNRRLVRKERRNRIRQRRQLRMEERRQRRLEAEKNGRRLEDNDTWLDEEEKRRAQEYYEERGIASIEVDTSHSTTTVSRKRGRRTLREKMFGRGV